MGLNIFVSNRCFIYCKGCYSYSREERCNAVLSTKVIEKFLKYAYDYGIKKVTLCGGDPLARNNIINLLEKVKDIGFSISIDTVGTPLLRDVSIGKKVIEQVDAQKISKLVNFVGIPIDGSSNEIIRLFRPTRRDILGEQIAICNILNDNKVKVCINTVVHKGNVKDAKKMAKIIKEIGAYKWQLFQYAPLGKYGFINKEKFEISEKEFDKFKEDILKECSESEIKIEFKKNRDRVKNYILIDNSGNAWIPEFEKIITAENPDSGRLIIGNIKHEDDWEKICQYVKGQSK
ncbi:MAG: radical SAM protein [Bacilli bacterium]|nr:radical SAM protein [Bacilli bacterium]